jgi:tetratricopeptide (TPR) repeat protein
MGKILATIGEKIKRGMGTVIGACINPLIKFKEWLKRVKNGILNKLLVKISSLSLEGSTRQLEERMKELGDSLPSEKGKDAKAIFDFISKTSKEDLEKIAILAETAKLIEEKDAQAVFKFVSETPKEELAKILAIDDDSKKSTIKNALEQIRRLRLVGLEVPAEDEIEKLKQIRMIMGIAKLLTKEEELERIKDVSKEPLESVSEKIHNMEIQEDLEERIKKIEEELKIKTQYGQELKIYSLYLEGIDLLKKGAFKGAYRYFDKITEKDSNLKGAWLNKGVALGNLGKFDEEIVCYKIALRIDKNSDEMKHLEKQLVQSTRDFKNLERR